MDEDLTEEEYIKNAKGPLPFVTYDTMKSFSKDKDDGYLRNPESVNEWLARVERENPGLKGYVDGYVQGVSPEVGSHVLWLFVGIYELLRRQAESDQLREKFEDPG